ncbi:MAG: RNA polymerase sigma factor SigF [Cyanobacteria bacterium P01_H01_bin.15]
MIAANGRVLKEETFQLLRAYQHSCEGPKRLELRRQLVTLNLGLVRKEAYRWSRQCPESFDDLLQIGSIGLLNAIERFELERGSAFSSFAVPYIRGEIQHYLRDRGHTVRIPRRWLEMHQKAVNLVRKHQERFHRPPTEREIAAELGIDLEEWQDIKLASTNREPLSLDAPVNSDNERISLGELVVDNQYRSFQLAQEDRIRLQQALAQLESKTRDVLEFVFLNDLTQKETAERLGISVVTVSRRVKRGLNHLKALMQTEIF